MKSFAQRRADRIAQIRAEGPAPKFYPTPPPPPKPPPPVPSQAERLADMQAAEAYVRRGLNPRQFAQAAVAYQQNGSGQARRGRPPQPRLLTVSENVLLLVLDILQSTKGADSTWRAVAAEAIRREL